MPDLLLIAEQLASFTSGLGTYARGLARGLAARGHRVTIAVPEEQAPAGEPYRVVPLPLPPGNVTPLRRIRMNRAIRPLLAAEAPAHDLVHFLDARWATCLPRRRPDRPLVGTIHDSYALDWLASYFPRRRYRDRGIRSLWYRWLRRIERRAYPRLTRLLTNSDHVSRTVATGYGIAPERLEVVRLGLPEGEPAEAVPLPGAPAVLLVGGNFQRKGLATLLESTARLEREAPGIEVHVVGRDPASDAFRRRAEDLGIGGRVHFHGWVENERVRGMMAGADVFAMPSYVEAFGLVYLEAMRAGTPVIATASGGAGECFVDGEEIRLVPPDDPGALATALLELVRDPERARRRAAAGRAAAERIPFEETVNRTVAVYEALLA